MLIIRAMPGRVVVVFVCCLLAAACGETDAPVEFDAATPGCLENSDCDDGNFCTFDFCDDGVCENQPENEAEECDDGIACTRSDSCQSGVCMGVQVDCSGLNDACNVGSCDADTGECVTTPMPDGTSCDDSLFCTDGDQCTAGECAGEPLDCSGLDSDCTEGVCDEDAASCVAMAINEGGGCDDGLFCTDGDTCTAGVCDGGPRDCSSASDQCNAGACDEDADACVPVPVTDGTICNDGQFCTPTDQCIGGACTGSGEVDCSGLDNQCNVGVCDNDAASCVPAPANEGGACNDGLFCSENETCNAGVCGGGTPVVCNDSDACTTDSCDEGADACVFNPVPPIPGAEGPPGDPTCLDDVDNDCDGDVDLVDSSCVACAVNSDCDDGNECTVDVCNDILVCEYSPVTDGTSCDDGSFCTTGETCTGGSCGGGGVTDCSALDDTCNVGTCSESTDSCVKTPANEGGSCNDGQFCSVGDTCSAGTCTGAPRDCSVAGGPCLTTSCNEASDSCIGTPIANGTPCDIGFCTEGETCTGGVCGGGSPIVCSDGDACTTDSCNELSDTCEADPLAIDPDSPVLTSATGASPDVCLVAGTNARVVVYTDLVDTVGLPIAGASVTIGGTPATESSARPGTYYIEHFADATPSTTNLSVEVAACGDTATLNTVVTIENAMENPTAGGTGGCSPMHGNLRVRVVDEAGAPLAGARVLVGDEETLAFETNPEALFGGASSLASNVATADGMGYVEFFDYATSLDGPVMTTAGATGRAYVTVAGGNASDLVLDLPDANPPEPGTSLYSGGTGAPSAPNCGPVEFAVVMPHLELDGLGTFNPGGLFGPNRCYDTGLLDPSPLPGNMWIPTQRVAVGFCIPMIAQAPWQIELANTADTGATEDLALAYVDMPYSDLEDALESGQVVDLLGALTYKRIGFNLDLSVMGDVSPNSISADDDYPNNFTVSFSGRPFETDVIGISLADRDGTNGIGPLLFLGTGIRPFTDVGNTVAVPNSDLNESSSPMGVRRMGALVAAYLDPTDGDRSAAVPANLTSAVSAIFIRDDGDGGAPFGPSGGTVSLSADFGLGAFLDVPGADFTDPAGFAWDNVTNAGNVPLFSRHELRVLTKRYLPVLDCATENDVRSSATVQWIVYRPFSATCTGGRECFDLPTLPASFPNASADVQKRPGLDQRVGSGDTCGSCPVAGETCVDPDGDGMAEAMCMGGAGTAESPYFTQEYEWLLHVYDLELAPDFDFDAFDFAERRLYMTHEASNSINFD